MPEEGEDGTVSEDVTEKLSSVDMVALELRCLLRIM